MNDYNNNNVSPHTNSYQVILQHRLRCPKRFPILLFQLTLIICTMFISHSLLQQRLCSTIHGTPPLSPHCRLPALARHQRCHSIPPMEDWREFPVNLQNRFDILLGVNKNEQKDCGVLVIIGSLASAPINAGSVLPHVYVYYCHFLRNHLYEVILCFATYPMIPKMYIKDMR